MAAGTIHSPPTARSQVEGGVVQGLSYALYEQVRIDPRSGLTVSACFDSYRIAGLGDAPEIEVHFEPGGFEHVGGGGAGVAELSTVGVAAATANAVAHAVGYRPKTLPITPGDVVAVLGGDG